MEALDEVLQRAFRHADDGEWDAVAELLREQLEEYDDAPAIHCWLGVAERELGMQGIAYERFKRALSLDPQDPHVLATAGNALSHFADPDAESALRAAALTAPEYAMGRMLYGAYLSREGFVDDALEELTAARELDRDDPQIAYELGVALQFDQKPQAAAAAVGEAVALDRQDPWIRAVFGLLLLEVDRWEEAAGELSEAARLAPHDVEVQAVASLAASAVGDEGLAFEMMERARMRGREGDQALLQAVEERLTQGSEAAGRLLRENLAPDMLRRRLAERP